MKIARTAGIAAVTALVGFPLAACSSDAGSTSPPTEASAPASTAVDEDLQTPSELLAAHAWKTTDAVDQDGQSVALTDEDVETYVGYAYFAPDGSFTMYTLDDEPKMQGDWIVSADGGTRTIIAKDDDGAVLFERESQITELTETTFTYRTFPDEDDTSVYIDIVHTPTDHPAPAAD